jgi:lysophospholipase
LSASFAPRHLKTPDGRFLRAGVWTLAQGTKPRAICVLLGGHAEFLEKYQEVADELLSRRFTVVSLDWRGQGASERLTRENRMAHVDSFEDYETDLAVLLKDVVRPLDQAPVIALAHSMGAHILLRYLREHTDRFRCAVLSAPMLGIQIGKNSPSMVRLIAELASLRKPMRRFVPGAKNRDPLEATFEGNLVTSDPARFERTRAILRKNPYLAISGPSFGWLRAALRSLAKMQKPGFAERLKTPLLVFGAGHDEIVKTEATRAFVHRLPDARYVEIKDAKHEILMENNAIRAQFWQEFDAFVAQQLDAA